MLKIVLFCLTGKVLNHTTSENKQLNSETVKINKNL